MPLDIEIRYSLHRGDSGIYGWTIADHDPSYPPFDIEVSTVCLKLNPDVFDFLSIDGRMQRPMASPEDWVKGTQLNLWEARRLNTGIRKGEVEHKYDYTMLFSRTPAWGWSGTKRKVGLFVVNPSIEYLGGSAVSLDYGGHLDVKASLPADPTLLFIWHSPHYGGRPIRIDAGERWRKIVGPFLLYGNEGETPEAMWKDALARAAREQQAWPYDWAEAPGYAHAAERGSASGRLVIDDPGAPAGAAPRPPPAPGSASRRRRTRSISRSPGRPRSTGRPTASITSTGRGRMPRGGSSSRTPAPASTPSMRSPTGCSATSAAPAFGWKPARRPGSAI